MPNTSLSTYLSQSCEITAWIYSKMAAELTEITSTYADIRIWGFVTCSVFFAFKFLAFVCSPTITFLCNNLLTLEEDMLVCDTE